MLIHPEPALRYDQVKDPIYGYIRLYEHESNIVNSPYFQRLRRISQLYSAQYVYPGATHTRFSHSLGVMHLSGIFISHLLEPLRKNIKDRDFHHFFLLARLLGLTHDLGHGPFSHTFDRTIMEKRGMNHEYMSSRIVREDPHISEAIDKNLKSYSIRAKTVAEYLLKTREEWTRPRRIGKTEHTERILFYILKGFYSTDIIDYLLRDNLYTGAGYGNFDWQRLIFSSLLYKDEIALNKKAMDTLDSFLLSRLFSFNTIYYHRWSRAVDYVITTFLQKADKKAHLGRYSKDLDKYLKLDESSIFHLKELRTIPERRMLLERQIPFRSADEVTLPISTPLLDPKAHQKSISERLESQFSSGAFFVDTPNLALNPMIGDPLLWVVDTSDPQPSATRERVRRTPWGEIPYSLWTVRLYVNVKYDNITEKIKKAFRLATKEGNLETHY